MKKYKIIIFGANGMLGHYIFHYFKKCDYEVIGLTRKHLDIIDSDKQDIRNILNLFLSENNIIINCAGMIPQRNCNDVANIIKVNALFPHILSNIISNIPNSTLMHITTDCVFSGKKGNYTESDIHDCDTLYGKTKSIGEPSDAMIIRTSIIGEEILNKKSLLEWVKSQKDRTVQGYTDHIWNGVTCLELAKQIRYMVESDTRWKGVRHIFSEVPCSKFQLVQWIDKIWNLNMTIEPVNNHKVDRSLTSHFQNTVDETIEQQLINLKEFDLLNI